MHTVLVIGELSMTGMVSRLSGWKLVSTGDCERSNGISEKVKLIGWRAWSGVKSFCKQYIKWQWSSISVCCLTLTYTVIGWHVSWLLFGILKVPVFTLLLLSTGLKNTRDLVPTIFSCSLYWGSRTQIIMIGWETSNHLLILVNPLPVKLAHKVILKLWEYNT